MSDKIQDAYADGYDIAFFKEVIENEKKKTINSPADIDNDQDIGDRAMEVYDAHNKTRNRMTMGDLQYFAPIFRPTAQGATMEEYRQLTKLSQEFTIRFNQFAPIYVVDHNDEIKLTIPPTFMPIKPLSGEHKSVLEMINLYMRPDTHPGDQQKIMKIFELKLLDSQKFEVDKVAALRKTVFSTHCQLMYETNPEFRRLIDDQTASNSTGSSTDIEGNQEDEESVEYEVESTDFDDVV